MEKAMSATEMPNRACIVGAGPGGLALARSFLHHGIAFDCFERHSDVGGIWDQRNPGSPIYDSAHFISSKTQSHYVDLDMPEGFPDYPSNRQIHQYMQQFAKVFGLYDHITFQTEVVKTEKVQGGWHVTLSSGETHPYRWLVCANGTNWHPSVPEFAGTFDGEIRHAVTYRSLEEFKGKRALIVGAGNSGCDIACDAAHVADAAFISLRRGYHFIPKHIFGKPADVFAHEGPHMPMWLTQKIFGVMLRLLNGDLTRLGLPKPDHKVFESHPIVNSQLLHYLSHGDVTAKGDIERLDGREVVFKDGSRELIDLIILATGYQWHIPYVERDLFDWSSNRPDLYMNLFPRKTEGLYTLGFMETNGGAYKLFDQMADLVGRAILADRDDRKLHRKFTQLAAGDRPDLSGGVSYVASDRHATYVNIDAYRAEMARLRKKMGWGDVLDGQFEHLRTVSSKPVAAE